MKELPYFCRHMKQVSIYVLTLLMLCQSVTTVWIVAGFHINRDYIAKNQCENRFLSTSPCKGQCVLMKKLKDQQEKEQETPDHKFPEIVQLSVTHTYRCNAPLSYDVRSTALPVYRNLYHFLRQTSIFHPPLS
jgi:hypothetical protein